MIANTMTTLDIQKALKSHKFTKKYFQGVFAINTIPKRVKSKPALYVINTDKSNQPGQHWLAVYFPSNGCGEFFDSYGRSATKYPEIKRFLKYNSKCIIYNNKQLQSLFTGVCGQYCCIFLLNRCKRNSMEKFIKLFNIKNQIENDVKIKKLFKKEFPKILTTRTKTNMMQHLLGIV